MKLLFKITVVVLVAGALGLGSVGWYIVHNVNALARKGIESGGTYALGVPTTVQDVALHPFGGELDIRGLNIANPQGFSAGHFFTLDEGELAVRLGSLREDVIEVPKFHLTGIDVNLQRKGGASNYQAILDNLAKLKSAPSAKPSSTSEKRLIIDDLLIERIRVHLDLLGGDGAVGQALSGVTRIEVPIERIQLSRVGRTGTGVGGTGVTTEQLASIIVQAVLAAAAENGHGVIPADILNDLKSGVGSLGGLENLSVKVLGASGDSAAKVIDQAGKDASKAIEDAGKKLQDGLGNLIPGGKKDDGKKK